MTHYYKIFIIKFIILLWFSNLAKAEEFNTLFGMKLLDNIEEYFESSVINNIKYKNPETIDNYFDVDVTDLINKKSPQIDFYTITIDNKNTIHSIYGEKELDNIENCTERVVPSIVEIFNRKYSLEFEYYEGSYTDFNIYSFYSYDNIGNPLRIQCNEGIDGYIYIQIVYQTLLLLEEVDRFYDSGF